MRLEISFISVSKQLKLSILPQARSKQNREEEQKRQRAKEQEELEAVRKQAESLRKSIQAIKEEALEEQRKTLEAQRRKRKAEEEDAAAEEERRRWRKRKEQEEASDRLTAAAQMGQMFQSFFEKLRELLTQAVRRLSSANTENTNKIVAAVREVRSCPLPWVKFRGMCLRLFGALEKDDIMNYHCKRQFATCLNYGGFLAWFENKTEHEAINAFVSESHLFPSISRYCIGLFRSGTGTLTWTGGSQSRYRGSPFQMLNRYQHQFYAELRSTEIAGCPLENSYPYSNSYLHCKYLPFICRRY